MDDRSDRSSEQICIIVLGGNEPTLSTIGNQLESRDDFTIRTASMGSDDGHLGIEVMPDCVILDSASIEHEAEFTIPKSVDMKADPVIIELTDSTATDGHRREIGGNPVIPFPRESAHELSNVDELIKTLVKQRNKSPAVGDQRDFRAFLWAVHEDLMEAPTQEDVIDVVCQRLVENELFDAAWICDRPPVDSPRATAGFDRQRVQQIHDAYDHRDEPAPWARAASDRTSVVEREELSNRYQDHPGDVELTTASIPLLHRGIIYCVLTVATTGVKQAGSVESVVSPLTKFGQAVGHALATTEMQAQSEIFQGAIEQAEPAIALLDEDGTLEYVNTAFTSVYGYPKSEAIGLSLDELLPSDLVAADILARARDAGTWREEVTQYRKSGERLFADLSVAGVLVEGGTRWKFVVVASDITSLKEREQRMQVLNRVLRHNLRNDVIPLQVRAELIAEDVVANPQEAAEVIRSGITEIIEMSEKVRTAADALDDPVESERFALVELLEHVASSHLERYDHGTIEIDVPQTLALESDWQLVELVVSNLVENALEHAGDDPTVRLAVADDSMHEGTVRLTVADDGPGIDNHELEVLQRGRESALEHGSGLGLWLADGAVTTLGGELTFDIDDDGTTVLIDLPGVVEDPS